MSIGVMLFCPFTGKPRHPSDIESDPKGILVWDGEEPLRAYTPQRTWVGLTDEKTEHLWEISRAAMPRHHTFKTLIEKALRERNT